MASPGLEARADVQPPQRRQHVEAQAAGADHRGDDHHVERQHDHLVDADHQAVARGRHQHTPCGLPAGAADHLGQVADFGRDGLQGQRGHPRHRRHGVNDGGDDRGRRPEAEQKKDRHQIGKHGYRLHQVEDRRQRDLKASPAIGRDPEQQAARHADRYGDQDRSQRHHRAGPLAEHGQEAETGHDQETEPPSASVVAHQADDRDHRNPGQRRQVLDRA